MASARTDPIPITQPEPETARQASGDQPAVRAAGLVKSYGPTVALAGLDLHVATGETVALLGPNGAGKTTNIGLLLGLLSPGRGHVQVYGWPPAQAVAGGLAPARLPCRLRLWLRCGNGIGSCRRHCTSSLARRAARSNRCYPRLLATRQR